MGQSSIGFGEGQQGGGGNFYSQGPEAQQQFLPNPDGSNSDRTSNEFLHSNYIAPYYNLAGVAGNLGTMQGLIAPQAANFQNQLFNPQLNQMEQTFLQSGTDSGHLSSDSERGLDLSGLE